MENILHSDFIFTSEPGKLLNCSKRTCTLVTLSVKSIAEIHLHGTQIWKVIEILDCYVLRMILSNRMILSIDTCILVYFLWFFVLV